MNDTRMEPRFLQHIQLELQKINQLDKERDLVPEAYHIATVAAIGVLSQLLNALGALIYDTHTHEYRVTINYPVGGYQIWAEDFTIF